MPTVYWEQPDYIPSSPPTFGKRREDLVSGDLVFIYIPTDTIYYFGDYFDVPAPMGNWEHIGTFIPDEDWEEIQQQGDLLDGIIDAVMGRISPIFDQLDSFFDNIEETIGNIQEVLGWTINSLVDTGRPDREVGMLALMGMQSLAIAGVQTGVVGGVIDFAKKLGAKLEPIYDAVSQTNEAIEKRIEQAEALYKKVAEAIHLEELKKLDTILSLTWDAYYNKKLELIKELGDVSYKLYGNVHLLQQWFAIAGMLWKDYASGRGQTWGEQDQEWFVRVNTFLLDIESDLWYYGRYPERLWIRIEDALLKPLYEERIAEGEATQGALAILASGISSLESSYRVVDRKLRNYELALPDNIRDTMSPILIQTRKDLRSAWRRDIRPLIEDVETRLLIDERAIQEQRRKVATNSLAVSLHSVLLGDPEKMTSPEVRKQESRFAAIQANLSKRLRSFSTPIIEAMLPSFGKTVTERMEK